MIRYNKPPLNYSEQVKLLELRGLIIGNKILLSGKTSKNIKFLPEVL